MNISRPKDDRANADRMYRRINKALRLAQSGDAENVLAAALEILSTRIKHGDAVNSPAAVRDYLRLLLHDREHEIFVVVLLDAQHRVLAVEELFRGTLTQTSVYPRAARRGAQNRRSGAVSGPGCPPPDAARAGP